MSNNNMFEMLAKTAKSKKSKKNDKPIININGDEFDVNLKSFVNLKKELDNVKTQFSLVQNYLKEKTLDKWYKLYKTNGSYPGSVLVTSDSESSFLFAPNDKYLSLNDDSIDELIDKYGKKIISENIKFTFNSKLLDKYASILTELIMNSDDIDEDDKMKLIIPEKNVTISKGSIEKAFTIGKGNIKEYLEDIQPIFSLRTPKLKG